MILLDFQTIFDSVWHKALLTKLHNIGITAQLWKIISNYLLHGNFSVTINGTYSTLKKIEAGVPQESILGPLFLAYINDLPMDKNTNIAIYEDDTAVCAPSWSQDKASTYIQSHMDTLINYFNNWKLLINPTKMQAISFSNKRTERPKQIKIVGHNIPWPPQSNSLGYF